MDGRCLICKGSTFEEDMPDLVDESTGEVTKAAILLCDGCNSEVHLHCLNLSTIPTGEWLCAGCTQRKAARIQRDTKGNKIALTLTNPNPNPNPNPNRNPEP